MTIRASDLDETNLDLDGRQILNRVKRLPDGAHEPNYSTPAFGSPSRMSRSAPHGLCQRRFVPELTPTDRAVAGSQELDGMCPAGLVVVEKLMERHCPRISFGICAGSVAVRRYDSRKTEDKPIAWTTPVLVEICIGLEINGYLPAEF